MKRTNDINMRKTILVSPHSDDIAFSLGGSLLQEVFGPSLMVTIFTKSKYSPCVKLSDSEKISNIRHLEDVEFADKLQIKFKWFNFKEPPLRGYSRQAIFAKKNPVSEPVYIEVYKNLSKLIKENQCELIVSPMGLGNHIDHIIVCNVCNRIAKENNIKIIFYEDLQYASILTLEQIRAIAKSINPDLEPLKINVTHSINNKIQNIKLYKTQARWISRVMTKSHALRLGMENKSLKELISSHNLYKYLIFLFTNKDVQIPFPLYERLWECEYGNV